MSPAKPTTGYGRPDIPLLPLHRVDDPLLGRVVWVTPVLNLGKGKESQARGRR